MIERQLVSESSGLTLEKFKKLKPGDQRIYLAKHPHSRYWAFHRRPTKAVKPRGKMVQNTHVVDGTHDPKQIEKAADDLAENNPELEKQIEERLSANHSLEDEGHQMADDNAPPDPEFKESGIKKRKKSEDDDIVDVDESDNKRLAINKQLDKRASTASTIMWAVLAAGALVAAPMLLPYADMVSKEFADSMRHEDEREVDKELTYDEYKKSRNKTGRSLTRDEDKTMRKHYDMWKEGDEDHFVITNDKPMGTTEEPKETTKDYIRRTAARAMTWLADKSMEKLEARYANMKRLQALQAPPKNAPK